MSPLSAKPEHIGVPAVRAWRGSSPQETQLMPYNREQTGSSSVSLIFFNASFGAHHSKRVPQPLPRLQQGQGPAHARRRALGGAQSQPGCIRVRVRPRHGMEKAKRNARDTGRLKPRNRGGLAEEESKRDESLNEQQRTVSCFVPHLGKDVIF